MNYGYRLTCREVGLKIRKKLIDPSGDNPSQETRMRPYLALGLVAHFSTPMSGWYGHVGATLYLPKFKSRSRVGPIWLQTISARPIAKAFAGGWPASHLCF